MVIYFSVKKRNFVCVCVCVCVCVLCVCVCVGGMISHWRVRLPTLRYETTALHCERDSYSACKEIPRDLWKPLSHFCVNRDLVTSLVSQRDECDFLAF